MAVSKCCLLLRTKGSESSPSSKIFTSLIVTTLCLVKLSYGANAELSHDLELLTSSKILMDHTSSVLVPSTVENLAKVVTRATSTTPLRVAQNRILSNAEYRDDAVSPFSDDNAKSSSEISSVHVAQCRATCLEKFANTNSKAIVSTTTSVSPPPLMLVNQNWDDDVNELLILPKIMRLRKRRFAPAETLISMDSSNKVVRNCKKDSSECFTCWNACQLFETGASNPEVASTVPSSTSSTSTSSPVYSFKSSVNEVAGRNAKQINFPGKWFNRLSQHEKKLNKASKSKESQTEHNRSQLNCISEDCSTGCQVACSFYEKLFAKNGGNEGSLSWNTVTTQDPVVATKPGSSVAKIVPGKISWLLSSPKNAVEKVESQKNDYDTRKMIKTLPVVYTVIPEFPARKWRQIAQTTEESDANSVSSGSSAPNENDSIHESDINKSKNPGKKFVAASQAGITALSDQDHKQNSDGGGSVTEKLVVEEADYITSESVQDNANSGGNESAMNVNGSPVSGSDIPTSLGGPELPADNFAEDKEFNLKVVSLIHRKSLVIAELKWNGIGGDARQDYLITWELKGGGLKGHLVTDSTSVTLSLWPETSYKVQVEQFQLNLDSDGPIAVESSSTSIKSVPLTVDTSEATFPTEKSSLDFTSDDNAEYDYNYHQDPEYHAKSGNEIEADDKEALAHKSIKGLHNMTLVLVITLSATILVLVILLATAFTWTRLQAWRKVGGFSCFSTSGKEPHLLASQEDIASSDDILGCAVVHSFHSPMDFVVGLKKQKMFQRSFGSSHPEKLAGLDSPEAPVAVISSSSSIPAPRTCLHGYAESERRNKNGALAPSYIVSLVTEKVPFCKSTSHQHCKQPSQQ